MKQKVKHLMRYLTMRHCIKVTAMCLGAILMIPIPVQAAIPSLNVDAYFEKQKEVLSVMDQIKDVHQGQLKALHEQLGKEILKNGYDYDLTYESLNEKGDPTSAVDYTGVLAAYMACKEYLSKEGIKRNIAFADICLFDLTVKESTLLETIPVRVTEYEKTDAGVYKESGYYYTQEPVEIPVYEKKEDDTYRITGKVQQVTPKQVRTSYADATIIVQGPDAVFPLMDVDKKAVQDRYLEYKEYISYFASNEGIRTTNGEWLTYSQAKDAEMDAYINSSRERIKAETLLVGNDQTWESANSMRERIVDAATSLVGQVPYLWGGKPTRPGYDPTWWSYRSDGKQNGLDCSGFVQWAYMTAGFPPEIYNGLCSTTQILSSCETIDKEDLLPGDIGLLNYGDSVNHCGIYLGDGKYVHCSSGKKTVIISDFPFTVYKRVRNSDINIIDLNSNQVYHTINIESYQDDNIMLTAKLMTSEAAGEGFNGQAAVAEVVKNRLESPLFPDTVSEIIYQEDTDGTKQFADNDRIEKLTPNEETIRIAQMVMSGQLKVLNDPNVLFYRRPATGDEYNDWGDYHFFTRINHHTFYSLPQAGENKNQLGGRGYEQGN